MNRKLKNEIFRSYEKEMNFNNRLEEAKEGLSFTVKKKPSSMRKMIPILASASLICIVGVSSYFAFSHGLSNNTKADTDYFDNEQAPTMAQKQKEVAFGENNEYCLVLDFIVKSDDILFKDKNSNLDMEKLIVKENGKILEHDNVMDNQFTCHVESIERHQISFSYLSYEGSFVIQNGALIL